MPLMFTSMTRANSSGGTSHSAALRLTTAALFSSRSGGPPAASTLLAHRATAASSDRVALGGYPPRAPTDPYVLALEHTVPQIMGSLQASNPACTRCLLSAPVWLTRLPNFDAFAVVLKSGP